MDLTFGTPLSQSDRLLQLTTPLGADQLQALRAHGVERIGRTRATPSTCWCRTLSTTRKNSSTSPSASLCSDCVP